MLFSLGQPRSIPFSSVAIEEALNLSKSNDFAHKPGQQQVPRNDNPRKCNACGVGFEIDWRLERHFRGKGHICKMLEYIPGSEELQKRIRNRELNAETFVDTRTGCLRLETVNRVLGDAAFSSGASVSCDCSE